MTSLLDGIVQHSCRTWSNTAAAGHYTHREASRNLELIPESKEMKLLGLYHRLIGVGGQMSQVFKLKSTLTLIYLHVDLNVENKLRARPHNSNS